jgi:hypothetical protein
MFKCWNCGTEHESSPTVEQLRAAFDKGYAKGIESMRKIYLNNKENNGQDEG